MDIVVGIFDNQQDAEEAVNQLDALDLEPDTIRVMTRSRIERGEGFFGSLARSFSGGDSPVSSALTSFGLDAEEAEFYDQELDEEGVLVAVKVDDDQAPRVMSAMREANGLIRD